MRYLPRIASLSLVLGLQLACDDPSHLTQPAQEFGDGSASGGSSSSGRLFREIQVNDACDGPSFNAAVGPGACSRRKGLLFDRFIALLAANQTVGAWNFNPDEHDVKLGTTLLAVNRGGEVHSFTKVRAFGGGVVDGLNQLSGNPTPAPECLSLTPQNFLPPGATSRTAVGGPGTEQFQCCIHPWMRSTITVRGD